MKIFKLDYLQPNKIFRDELKALKNIKFNAAKAIWYKF